jgi:hypothetical protein
MGTLVWGRVRVGTGAFARPAERSEAESEIELQEYGMTNKSKLNGLGIALGALLGAVFGLVAGHVGIWLAVGVAIGMLLGATLRGRQTDCAECAQLHRAHDLKTHDFKTQG